MSQRVLKTSIADDMRRFIVELPSDPAAAHQEILRAIAAGFGLTAAQASALQSTLKCKDGDGDLCSLHPATIPDFLATSEGCPLRLFAESIQANTSSSPSLSQAHCLQTPQSAEDMSVDDVHPCWQPWAAAPNEESGPSIAGTMQSFLSGLVTGSNFAALLLHFAPLFASQLDAEHKALDELASNKKDVSLALVRALREGIEPFPQFAEVQIALDGLLQETQLDGLGQTLALFLRKLAALPKDQLDCVALAVGGVAERVAKSIPDLAPALCCSPGGSQPPVHARIVCDGCGARPVTGPRFKCATCPDYDLCGNCYLQKDDLHPGHTFECLTQPVAVSDPMGHGWHKGWGKGWHKGWGKGILHWFLKGKGKGKGKKGWKHHHGHHDHHHHGHHDHHHHGHHDHQHHGHHEHHHHGPHADHHYGYSHEESAWTRGVSSDSTSSDSSMSSSEERKRQRRVDKHAAKDQRTLEKHAARDAERAEKHAARDAQRAARNAWKSTCKEAKRTYKLQVKAAKQEWKERKKTLKLEARAAVVAPSPSATQMDAAPTTEAVPEKSPLQVLAEMGFENIELNSQLLEHHHGNVQAVLEVLLGGGKVM